MKGEELVVVSNMCAACSGIFIFVLSAILGALFEKKLNWFKW